MTIRTTFKSEIPTETIKKAKSLIVECRPYPPRLGMPFIIWNPSSWVLDYRYGICVYDRPEAPNPSERIFFWRRGVDDNRISDAQRSQFRKLRTEYYQYGN